MHHNSGMTNLTRVVFSSTALTWSCTSPPAPPPDYGPVFDGRGGQWIDLTHSFSESTIYWPTDTQGFQLEELAFGPTPGGWFYASYQFASAEHGGTHLDAPIHFAENRRTTDDIPLLSLMGPTAVVDVTAQVTPDYLVTREDLARWEATHGPIQAGAIVLFRTGWADRWEDRTAYLGTPLTGEPAVAELRFPGLSEDAARWLAHERDILAVGIDTPSIDRGRSTDFRAHVVLYAKDIAGFENLADLSELPATGSYVIALPMKIAGGSGAPLRIAAFIPH